MTSSPSEFLTFYRYASRGASVRALSHSTSTLARRTFHTSRFTSQKDMGPDKTHTLDKNETSNVQSDSSMKGREQRANDDGGNATQQKDTRNNTERAKKEHPEAPDVVIGMQDERGTKGH